jgi:ribonuclease HI
LAAAFKIPSREASSAARSVAPAAISFQLIFKNLSIIQDAHAVYARSVDGIQLSHLRVHTANEGNGLADRMAMYAVTQRDDECRKYTETMDIGAIARMRAG